MTPPTDPDTAPRALYSAAGKSWAESPGTGPVTKIVIGRPPKDGEKAEPVALTKKVAADLAKHMPTVTHLHLWQLKELALPVLPAGLRCLDVRGCAGLKALPELPAGLETLVVEGAPLLKSLSWTGAVLPELREVSLRGCAGLPEKAIHTLLAAASGLKKLDLSGCRKLTKVPGWSAGLDRIDLNECISLAALPPWPAGVRRVGLRKAAALTVVPDFPAGLDYLDLAGTKALRELPEGIDKLRTLFLHGSGVELPPTLFGEDDKANVAATVLAYLREADLGTVVDHEVKVILLGNGRCGKSSLVRRVVEGKFDAGEPSTHGIRLRTMELDFTPVDEPGLGAKATLNIWDFAGQDLYHNTHRTFLQSKAVYVLCVTNHGDGASPEGDKVEDPDLEPEDDVRRALRYWREQVAALGNAPGMDEPPPILLVRMKADRDGEPGAPPPWLNCEAGEGLERFNISAESGAGVEEFKKALAKAVAVVLGPKARRSLGRRPMKVKDALRQKKAENEAAMRAGQKRGVRAPSPHPTLGRAEFDALVRRHCLDGDYHRDPGLLLEQLHLSGFLSYNAQYLPETVILDQPWAFEAVYTVMHRGRCHPKLKAQGGRFTPADLAEWAWSPDKWNPTGYTPAEQELFLKFMESHRVAAKLFDAAERHDGQAVYVAPYYLPGPEAVRPEVEKLEAGEHGPAAKALIVSPHLGRDVAQGLLIELVRRFSRTARIWKWGAHFHAHSLEASVTLDWKPLDRLELFGGEITLHYRGADAVTLHHYVVERLRELRSFPPDAEVNFAWEGAKKPVAPAKPHGEGAGPVAGVEAPNRTEQLEICVALSYAGSDPKSATPALQNLGALPQALRDELRARKIPVMEYASEVERSRLDSLIHDLVKQDYLVVFLSEKYFMSPYCMWELMLLYTQPPARVFPPGRALFLALPGVVLRDNGKVMAFRAKWEKHWAAWCEENRKAAKKAAGKSLAQYEKRLKDVKPREWYEFASRETERDGLLAEVLDYRFHQVIKDACAFEPGTDGFRALVDKQAEDVAAAIGKAEIVYQMAARLWQAGEAEESPEQRSARKTRAKQLYYRARSLEPDYDPATDAEKMRTTAHEAGDRSLREELNEIRAVCLAELNAGR